MWDVNSHHRYYCELHSGNSKLLKKDVGLKLVFDLEASWKATQTELKVVTKIGRNLYPLEPRLLLSCGKRLVGTSFPIWANTIFCKRYQCKELRKQGATHSYTNCPHVELQMLATLSNPPLYRWAFQGNGSLCLYNTTTPYLNNPRRTMRQYLYIKYKVIQFSRWHHFTYIPNPNALLSLPT